jgi:hypothetical protein
MVLRMSELSKDVAWLIVPVRKRVAVLCRVFSTLAMEVAISVWKLTCSLPAGDFGPSVRLIEPWVMLHGPSQERPGQHEP